MTLSGFLGDPVIECPRKLVGDAGIDLRPVKALEAVAKVVGALDPALQDVLRGGAVAKRPCLANEPVQQDAFISAASTTGLLKRCARRQRNQVQGLVT